MKHLAALLGLVVSANAFAQTAPPDLFLRELSRCDRGFFEQLGAHRNELGAIAPLRSLGTSAAFKVPEPAHRTRSRVMFAQPVAANGVTVLGYFDEVLDIPNGMTSYAWGYLLAGTVEAATTQLRPLVWDPMRLRQEDGVYVRSEVWTHDKPNAGWVRTKTESGAPLRGTVERVLLIEPYDGESAFIRFGCAIQGNITDPLLRDIRPDLRD